MPPITAISKTGKPVMKSKFPVWIDWSWLAYSAPPKPAMPAEIANTAVFVAIKRAVDGTFKGGNIVFALKDNGVAIGKISPKVPKSEVAAVNKVRAEIISGKITNIPTLVK